MTAIAPDTDYLLDRAAAGDAAARQQLLDRNRRRLQKMIALRLDRRLAARIDPSDVVQKPRPANRRSPWPNGARRPARARAWPP